MAGAERGRIFVVGGGSWGTALANLLAGAGHDVTIWARELEVVEGINRERENTVFPVRELSVSLGIEMPICDQVHAVLYEGKSAADVAHDLMVRPLRDERSS